MGKTAEILDEVQRSTAPSAETYDAVRERLDAVLTAAGRLHGTLPSFRSGSMAHRTANDDTDGDGGIILDRRTYPELGPDGDGVGPAGIMEAVRSEARDRLKILYPDLTTHIKKRSIKFIFHDPLPNGTDPPVDLIVGLNRDGEGIWIPNKDRSRWDPSDPQRHTDLLTAGPASLRQGRATIIRLVKKWNKSFADPGLISFNIEALALEAIEPGMGITKGLRAFFEYSAREIAKHNTKDPAGVSPPIVLLIDRSTVVRRLEGALAQLDKALENDDDEQSVRNALSPLFPITGHSTDVTSTRAKLANELRSRGNDRVRLVGAVPTVGLTVNRPVKTTRSYGGRRFGAG